ncbi:MAG: DNRLRE domain-containing protein [Verrucomicrobiaceae bacterium]|nr:MAG: DNRLRE domain-containing protein [Verrucomicrobiaceae bacterium]
MVKNADDRSQTNRRAYLRFDLGLARAAGLREAELTLTLVPSALGFGSLVPDSHFRVYGLLSEAEDSWPESGITWKNAPGHLPDRPDIHTPDPARTTPVGDFTIRQGRASGTVTLTGKALLDFLATDTNGLATFIVCRLTNESAQGGLVHAFASKEHENAHPPALKLRFANP